MFSSLFSFFRKKEQALQEQTNVNSQEELPQPQPGRDAIYFEGGLSNFESPELRFHPAHGKAIRLEDDFQVALRKEHYFQHSLVFSHRPIQVDEVVAVEIVDMIYHDFAGPLKIGLTYINPSSLPGGDVPLPNELVSQGKVWLKPLLTHKMRLGMTIFFTLKGNGKVLYGIDGKNEGIFLRGVDPRRPVWAIFEVYGQVQGIRLPNTGMLLWLSPQMVNNEYLLTEKAQLKAKLINSIRRKPTEISRPPSGAGPSSSLCSRRNVHLSPLPAVSRLIGTSAFGSPITPAYATPGGPFMSETLQPQLCIICTENASDTALITCGHVCMCFKCAVEFKNRQFRQKKQPTCPMCRDPITSILRVFFP